MRAQEAARTAILERLERATTAPELQAALALVGPDSACIDAVQLDDHRERLGDLLATTIDDAEESLDRLREAVRHAAEAEAQVCGKSHAFEMALRSARLTLAEAQAECRRRALRKAAGAPEDLPEMPNEFKCAITLEPMRDPVTAADGYTYERYAIERHLSESRRSPMTNEEMSHARVMSSMTIKKLIREWPEREHERIMSTMRAVREQLARKQRAILSEAGDASVDERNDTALGSPAHPGTSLGGKTAKRQVAVRAAAKQCAARGVKRSRSAQQETDEVAAAEIGSTSGTYDTARDVGATPARDNLRARRLRAH